MLHTYSAAECSA